jgi:hypothetical protein
MMKSFDGLEGPQVTNKESSNFIGRDGKNGDILRGSGANVARCSLGSLGGVLSPPTSASSAFRFPVDCNCPMTGGVFGLFKTEVEGIVGWDL